MVSVIRPNKKISVFLVMGLKILGRVGTHIFVNYFLLEKNIISCILKGEMPFKMHKIIYFFPENLKKVLGFTIKYRLGRVTLNTGIFLFGLMQNGHFSNMYFYEHFNQTELNDRWLKKNA